MNDFWQDRDVFVTGCTGILGSWLTMDLVERGAHVVGLIYDEEPRSWLWRSGYGARITRVHGSVTDYELMERVLNEYEIDTCFHLAAQSLVTVGNRAPLSTFETNIKGTWCLLEAARRSPKLQRVVVASSDKAYGEQEMLPYTEEAPLRGRHPYDVSKSCADLIALTYANTYGLPVGITRCGNIYGGGDLHWNRVVPGTIRSVLHGERPIVRSDGTQAILDAAGRSDLEPVVLGEAVHEIQHQYLDSSKARRLLGWEPRWSLDEGLRETLAWYRDFFAEGG